MVSEQNFETNRQNKPFYEQNLSKPTASRPYFGISSSLAPPSFMRVTPKESLLTGYLFEVLLQIFPQLSHSSLFLLEQVMKVTFKVVTFGSLLVLVFKC